VGQRTSAIGLTAIAWARTAVAITCFMICAALTTVAGARRVLNSLTHAWQPE
jgi:hypothetical protein